MRSSGRVAAPRATRPEVPRSLRESLRLLLVELEQTTGTAAELRTRGELDRVPQDAAAMLLAVGRECAVGLQRHARSTVLLMSVHVDVQGVTLEVRDDGVDLVQRCAPGWQSSNELTLARLARTVAHTGGALRVAACRPRGLRFRAVLPLVVLRKKTDTEGGPGRSTCNSR